jgi:hypothetical protein
MGKKHKEIFNKDKLFLNKGFDIQAWGGQQIWR